jgi:phosphatidylglycerophosphate synthase
MKYICYMENNEEIEFYEGALKKYKTLLHIVCIASIVGIVSFTHLEWYILVPIFIFTAYHGIKRLRWIHLIQKLADEEGFNAAEFIFKDL